VNRTTTEFFRQIGLSLASALALMTTVPAQPGPKPACHRSAERFHSAARFSPSIAGDVAKTLAYSPNEVGLIPIIEYHAIGGEAEFKGGARYDVRGLNIAPDTFRSQLKRMYAAGWYPVNMRDALSPRMNVPRGKIPVVLTFDDARPSQFRYLQSGKLDPDCAVGILEAFHRQHPGWRTRASFYVLPENGRDDRFYDNGVPFDQDGLETRKLRFLVQHGYEIGNHSTTHRSMYCLSARTLRWEMAHCARYVRMQVPGVTVDTMALPYGIAPSDPYLWDTLLSGTMNGITYHNRCILWADGGPAYPPTHRKFDPRRIPRILPTPGNVEHWIETLKPGGESEPYVSDGDPDTVTAPTDRLSDVDRHRLSGAKLQEIAR
jgi:peptidoglycan/xylan/chitin deacetylase (PgdA/CDA1 family)